MRRDIGILMNVGVVGILVAGGAFDAWVVARPAQPYPGGAHLGWVAVYGLLLVVSLHAFGLPDLPVTRVPAAIAACNAVACAGLVIAALGLAAGHAFLPRFVVLAASCLVPVWGVVCWRLGAARHQRAIQRDRVLVVGDPDEAVELSDQLARAPERPAVITATVSTEAAGELGHSRLPLVGAAEAARATTLVLTGPALKNEFVVRQASMLHDRGCRVRTLMGFYQEWLGKLPVSELEATSLLFDIGDVHAPRYVRAKRLVDIYLAVVGLVALVVVVPVVVVGNVIANRGSLWFRQPRVGHRGDPFVILKFRTMQSGGVVATSEWTQQGDARVTPFGSFLRRTHLDELPQVVNVLRGDLSVVGPRPEQPHYVEELRDKLPFYDVRHLVRPGLTGWAQVKYGYAADDADAFEKLQYDFYYLQHQSLTLDLRIIRRTLRAVLRGGGR